MRLYTFGFAGQWKPGSLTIVAPNQKIAKIAARNQLVVLRHWLKVKKGLILNPNALSSLHLEKSRTIRKNRAVCVAINDGSPSASSLE